MSDKKFIITIFEFLKHYIWYYILLLLVMVYNGIHISLEPYLLKIIINKTIEFTGAKSDILRHVMFNILLFIGASIFCSICWAVKHLAERAFIPEIETKISMKIFYHLQYHSQSYFQKQFAGTLANKISDLHAGINRIVSHTAHFVRMIVGILVATIIMYTVHPTFAIIIFTWSMAFLLTIIVFVKNLEPNTIQRARVRSKAFGHIVDSLTNILSVHLFAQYEFESKKQIKSFEKYVKEDKRLRYKQILIWSILGLLATVLLAIMVIFLVYGYSQNWINAGDFAFIMITSLVIVDNMFYMMDLVSEFIFCWGTAKQGAEILTKPHDIKDLPNAKNLKINRGYIQFKNVTFGYIKKPLLNNVSIKIFGGQKVGLVGYSGSGKTTFVNLILRLYDIKKGKILIDDQNIREVSQMSLRQSIGFIQQEPILFHRSIYENIIYGKLRSTKEEVIKAAKMAHAHAFISRMPDKYDSIVGERGLKLSGGQRQRLAIARAYLKNAPVLIIDEGTSALDSTTERLIQKSLKTLMQDKTVIIIAHRLSTLLDMDRILVFDDGKIVEDGTHEDLLKNKNLYFNLWSSQINGFIK